MAAPRRQKRHDRILHGSGASQAEIRCDMATGPFDAKAREMDRKWGVDRLPDLVSPATAERWGLAISQLNDAISACDVSLTVARVEACLRGFAVMDAEATAAGNKPASPDLWQHEHLGHRFAIIRDGAEWPAAEAARPDLTIYSMQEVAAALHAWRNSVADFAAEQGAASRRTTPETPLEKALDDAIPF